MNDSDVKKLFYESARAELIQRIQLRDNVALLYLAAIAAIFGIALAKDGKLEILLIVPLLSLAASVLTSQHHILIGALGKYCSAEICIDITYKDIPIPQWDNSKSLQQFFSFAMNSRAIGHLCIFSIPAIAGLALNYKYSYNGEISLTILFYMGCFVTILEIIYILDSFFKRKKLFAEQINQYSQQCSER